MLKSRLDHDERADRQRERDEGGPGGGLYVSLLSASVICKLVVLRAGRGAGGGGRGQL